ncbi:MAG: bifunctional adenosylcobinamide kinase/adenosylcobinamide-phosphate guanylyltransferase, partial [Lachnospiraceae bacterium]|nr:bifunctional adenosylcobinamide kinase/adenosylcobinamide-phosphate guanylyltransferase [Lachnospiraceae bacterium]
MAEPIIATADGNISVYQGLSGQQYDRIYLMLGANDLGYYPWENFLPTFESVLEQFHELQPHAIIYVCSVIYVDESKVAAGFEYDNNDNVRTINGYILQACEDLWYCYYMNLNEIFSDGVTYDPDTARYIARLGEINRALAARADAALEVVCGIPLVLKG